MQTLDLSSPLYGVVRDHGKRHTIRLGRRDIKLGPLVFTSSEGDLVVEVYMVIYLCVKDLSEVGIRGHQLKRFYPEITDDDEVTLVKFDL